MAFQKNAALNKHHEIENRIINNLKQIQDKVINIKFYAASLRDIK